jgi:hypothetical protein
LLIGRSMARGRAADGADGSGRLAWSLSKAIRRQAACEPALRACERARNVARETRTFQESPRCCELLQADPAAGVRVGQLAYSRRASAQDPGHGVDVVGIGKSGLPWTLGMHVRHAAQRDQHRTGGQALAPRSPALLAEIEA